MLERASRRGESTFGSVSRRGQLGRRVLRHASPVARERIGDRELASVLAGWIVWQTSVDVVGSQRSFRRRSFPKRRDLSAEVDGELGSSAVVTPERATGRREANRGGQAGRSQKAPRRGVHRRKALRAVEASVSFTGPANRRSRSHGAHGRAKAGSGLRRAMNEASEVALGRGALERQRPPRRRDETASATGAA